MSENHTSPPLQALHRVWDDFLGGIATEQDVLLVLEASAELAQLQIDGMMAQVEAGESDLKNPIFQQLLQGFHKHLEAVDVMTTEFDEPELGHFERGLELAQQATNQLARAQLKLMAEIDEMGNVSCMFCSQSNPRGTERCSKCGRALPVAEGERPQELFSTVNADGLEGGSAASAAETENTVRLAAAVERWREGTLDSDGLLAELEEIEGKLLAHRDANEKFTDSLRASKQPGADKALAAAERTEVGLDGSLDAVDCMKQAAQQDNEALLDAGLNDFRAAAQQLVEAYRALEVSREG